MFKPNESDIRLLMRLVELVLTLRDAPTPELKREIEVLKSKLSFNIDDYPYALVNTQLFMAKSTIKPRFRKRQLMFLRHPTKRRKINNRTRKLFAEEKSLNKAISKSRAIYKPRQNYFKYNVEARVHNKRWGYL